MKSDHETQSPCVPRSGNASETAQATVTSHRLGTRVAAGCAVLFTAVGLSLLLSSCGGEKLEQSSHESGDPAEAVPAQHVEIPQGLGASPVGTSTVPPVSSGSAASRPPDLAASTIDTTVAPGTTVEITAEATGDVTDVVLRDGRGDVMPFVYDVEGKLWTASYRVPLHPASERIALSVTARNDLGRWRRVWVFVKVARPALEPASAEEDTSESGC